MSVNRKSIGLVMIAAFLSMLPVSERVEACSRVLWSESGNAVVVGRTMDWFEDMKTNLWLLPRGVVREGVPGNAPLKWTSKYGSVVATGYDFCTADGINERGLTTNILWLVESDYGARDAARPGLPLSLWAQYMLDNFETVSQVVEFMRKEPFQLLEAQMPGRGKATVHLSLADASGDSAIIEYIGGKPRIHHSGYYTVMTNSPIFEKQLSNLKRYKAFGGDRELPGSIEAADRFVRAAYYLSTLPEPKDYRENIAFVLSIVRNISAPFAVYREEGRPNISATRWRTVADLTNRVYFFESVLSPNIVWVSLDKLNFKAGAPVKKLDLVNRADLVGDVTKKFKTARPFVFLGTEGK